jgi:hypothetical protein
MPSSAVFAILLLFAVAHPVFAERGVSRIRVVAGTPLLVAALSFSEPSGNGALDAGESGTVTVTVRNDGKGDAFGVRALLKADGNVRGLSFDGEMVFGTVPAGGSVSRSVSVNAEEGIGTSDARILFDFREAGGHPLAPMSLALRLLASGSAAVAGDDVDRNVPKGKGAGESDVAVVIGNRNYAAPGVPPVDFADRDAASMREYLVSTFGFRPENIIFEKDAGLAKFSEIFGSESEPRGKLYHYVRPKVSRVLVYYAGHGAPDLNTGEAYFVPVDANPRYIGSSGYRLRTFYENLAKVPAKSITIILDSCFSGSSARGMLFKDISPVMVRVKKDYDAPANALLLTSAGPEQVSTWYPDKGHSLFTYFFLKGIQGAADGNGDGAITVAEIKAYLESQVPYMARRLGGVDQVPVIAGNGDEVIVRFAK